MPTDPTPKWGSVPQDDEPRRLRADVPLAHPAYDDPGPGAYTHGSTDPQPDLDALEEAAQEAGRHAPGEWHEGISGNCAVVRFDHDDVVGVAQASGPVAKHIALANPATVAWLVQRARRCEELEEIDDICPRCGQAIYDEVKETP